ncbi:hypothetical protein [Aneurinibacillus tyrosinisolvens]|jgi:ketol-acid reductoisomerase|uniref:hypothetical protein n=1 Tax=Aneurinibacillus tyrosinisolvens TaxID=1443435 RepID=UPI00063F8397|nr:hypothetical protein [Aneurinibacillus tyrosinisolvens]
MVHKENLFKVPDYLLGKKITILGYSVEGQAYAQFLMENQIQVVIGLRPADDLWSVAERDGHEVRTLWEAVEEADIIQVW